MRAAAIGATIGLVLAAVLFAGMNWFVAAVSHSVQRSSVMYLTEACLGGDIFNERKLSECHALAEREVARRRELRSRNYAPAKPE